MATSTTSWRSTTRATRAYSQRIGRSAGWAAVLAALAAAGCAPAVTFDAPRDGIGPDELLRAAPLVGDSEPPPVPAADLLGMDEDMRRFVAANVSRKASRERRLQQLLEVAVGEGRLGVQYGEQTYTASETFRNREANCLSFTSLFIALARDAGLNAQFQEVDVPPDWTRSGDMLVLNRHVNALVITGDALDQVVDFNIRDFRATYDRRAISDSRALAHYYGNLAAESVQRGASAEAVRYFRAAVAQDPGFVPAWVNLGTLYLRAGYGDWARAAWHHALVLDPGELVAMSNLERLEREQGNIAAADQLRQHIGRHRMRNPYYRYYLAQVAFDRKDYDAAIGHLKVAVRQKETEDRFFGLLGLSYLRQGDAVTAQRWLARAEELANESEQRDKYHSKLEMLKRVGAG